jgi:hypothetical protein
MEAQLRAMRRKQDESVLLRVNNLADACFDACITDFALTKQLKQHETLCVADCTKKYLALSALVGVAFATASLPERDHAAS